MTATTIVVANQKGGVGKSAMVANIGAFLADQGQRVRLIDFDPQGNLGMMLNIVNDKGIPPDRMFELLVLDKDPRELLIDASHYTADSSSLFVIPGYERTDTAIYDMQRRQARANDFSQRIEALRQDFDIILIDTGPTISAVRPMAMLASDYLLVPMIPGRLELHGAQRAFEQMMNLVKDTGHRIRPMGIVLTQTRPHTYEHRERVAEAKGIYDDYVWDDEDAQFTHSVVWKEAVDVALPVYRYVPDHKAAGQLANVCHKIMDIVTLDQIEVNAT